jgi:hypothetical protein
MFSFHFSLGADIIVQDGMVRFWDIRKKSGVKAIAGLEKGCEVSDITYTSDSSHDFLVASGKKVMKNLN